MERCKVTGESSKHTGKVQQQEVAEDLPQDHESDQCYKFILIFNDRDCQNIFYWS